MADVETVTSELFDKATISSLPARPSFSSRASDENMASFTISCLPSSGCTLLITVIFSKIKVRLAVAVRVRVRVAVTVMVRGTRRVIIRVKITVRETVTVRVTVRVRVIVNRLSSRDN